MRILSILGSALPLLGLLLIPGCVTTQVGPPGITRMPDQPVDARPVEHRTDRDTHPSRGQALDPKELCESRLENVITALYQYYALYKRLPDKVETLQPFAEPGIEPNFTCPATGKPYIYNAAGLMAPPEPVGLKPAPGEANTHPVPQWLRLIVYDATPAHNGIRMGIVGGLAPNPRGPAFYQMSVVELSEKVFKSLVQAPAPPPPAAQDPTTDPVEIPAVPPVVNGSPGQRPDAPPGQAPVPDAPPGQQ